MKAKLIGAIMIAVVLLLVFAVVAQAGTVSQATINAIIKDAADGHLDGRSDGTAWTAAEIRATLQYVTNNPLEIAYPTRVKGVLEDFLASLQGPGEQSGQLAFTGGEIILILGAGAGLIGSGALLRRRRA